MPKTVTVEGTISQAFGKPLSEHGINDESGKLITVLPLKFTYEQLQKGDEIPAKEQPDADDLLTYVNNKRKANARQQETNEVYKRLGIKAPVIGEDKLHTFREMFKMLKASRKELDEATLVQMTNANLGTDFTAENL